MPDNPSGAAPERPWQQPAQSVLSQLGVQAERGLSGTEVRRRIKRFGENKLRQVPRRSAWRVLANQLTSLMVVLLGGASILSFLLIDWIEGTAIAAVIAINTAIGFFTELKAIRSMEALHRLGQVHARVRRDGDVHELAAEKLVPGDIVLCEGGDVVTADLRVITASRLQANESALTGESAPVDKTADGVAADAILAERASMLFKGTALTRGAGEAVVVATGLATELGKITALVADTEAAETPLEQRLARLGRRLIWVTLTLTAAIGAVGIAMGRDLVVMLETVIALAVAAVPEGLPVVATIALARGMWRMARHNALINRLSAVETLGATGVICTDKTGTLTENRMTLVRLALAGGEFAINDSGGKALFERSGERIDPVDDVLVRQALEIGVLCNNAQLDGRDRHGEAKAVGDPMEIALLAAAANSGITRNDLLRAEPEAREEAFDPETKMMATFHRAHRHLRIAVKGAPEAVIRACTHVRSAGEVLALDEKQKEQWLERNAAMATEGLRVIALATAQAESPDADPYRDLTLLGLAGLLDPPREDVREALESCRAAGIKVVMVTGDQAATAVNIARAVGLTADVATEAMLGSALKASGELGPGEREKLLRTLVFARVSPAEKLHLVALHQEAGAVVAMTGDGVNDAPALKKADIGIAMGQRGTQVAREAAAMVLRDDSFRSIVIAIAQGRVIFDNIRKFVLYLLSCNVGEVLVVGLATLTNAPLPILPLQILFLNLVTDVFPALALGVGAGGGNIMSRRPRPAGEAILTGQHWLAIGVYGALFTIATLGAFWLAVTWLALAPSDAVTVSFLTLGFAQLWHVFNMRDTNSGILRNDIVGNAYVWGALVLCTALLVAAVYIPALASVLGIVVPGPASWLLILTASIVPYTAGQAYLVLRRVRRA